MSAALLEKIRKEADTLTPEEKISLAEHLWATIPEDPEIEKAWLAEAEKRTRDFEAGKTGSVAWEDIKSKFESHIEKFKTL